MQRRERRVKVMACERQLSILGTVDRSGEKMMKRGLAR